MFEAEGNVNRVNRQRGGGKENTYTSIIGSNPNVRSAFDKSLFSNKGRSLLQKSFFNVSFQRISSFHAMAARQTDGMTDVGASFAREST